MDVSVDTGPDMTALGEVAAWSFDLDHWGECGQGPTEYIALANLARRTGTSGHLVIDRITAEMPAQVFAADMRPASMGQIEATATILRQERVLTIALVAGATPEQPTAENDDVIKPAWMHWRTADAIAWHIADTESRHYVRLLGLGQRAAAPELISELKESGTWIQEVLRAMPSDAHTTQGSQVWTAVKVLRRLAWHERAESVFLRRRLKAAGASVR